MALSGQITLRTESVDWIGYDYGPYGRGAVWLNTIVGYTVNTNNDISFNYISQTTSDSSWGICGNGGTDYRIGVTVQYNTGNGWTTISFNDMLISVCPSQTNTIQVISNLVNGLPSAHLSRSGQLRILYSANDVPRPTQSLPHAFPNSVYSEETQVPIHIELDYRPGATLNNGTYLSHNRTGGKCHILSNGSWQEMKTTEGKGDAPAIRRNDAWVNQRKIGKE